MNETKEVLEFKKNCFDTTDGGYMDPGDPPIAFTWVPAKNAGKYKPCQTINSSND